MKRNIISEVSGSILLMMIFRPTRLPTPQFRSCRISRAGARRQRRGRGSAPASLVVSAAS
eukprot:5531191-Pleurochrysis_carterae.AAC.2